MTERNLVKALRENERKAFSTIFNTYYKIVCAYILTFTKNIALANDIAQESFIMLWNKRSLLKEDTKIKSYLFKISYNKYIDHYRKQLKNDKFLDEIKHQSLQSYSYETEDLKVERLEKFNVLIANLPPKCKEILLLNKKEKFTYNEIADSLNISVKTVESQMRIAFQKLREGIKK